MRPLKRPKERMTADFLPARAIRKCFELLVILSCDARSRTSSFDYLVSVRKRLFSAVAASIFELACAAYRGTPPRKPLISLPRQKIPRFRLGNLPRVHPESLDEHYSRKGNTLA